MPKKKRPIPPGFSKDNTYMTVVELCKKYHASGNTVQRWRNECGTEPRQRRKRQKGKDKVIYKKPDYMKEGPHITMMCLNCDKPDCKKGWCEKVGYL